MRPKWEGFRHYKKIISLSYLSVLFHATMLITAQKVKRVLLLLYFVDLISTVSHKDNFIDKEIRLIR